MSNRGGKQKDSMVNEVCQTCQQKTMVDNSLLMYVSSYASRASRLNTRSIVLNFYSDDAIMSAKQVLEENVKEYLPDHPAIGVRRTGSSKRSASDAIVDDIIDLMTAIRKVDAGGIPLFVCSDAKSLPNTGPEEAGNMLTVLETLASQQQQIRMMQESMSLFRIDLDKVNKNQTTVAINHNIPVADHQPSDDSRETEKQFAVEATSNAKTSCEASEVIPVKEDKRNYSNAIKQKPKDNDTSSSFQAGGKRPNKGMNKSAQKTSLVRQSRIGGTNDSNALRAGPSRFQLQITNVNNELSTGDIKKYMSEKGVEVVNIEDKSSDGWETKRFLITLLYQDYETVMKADFWPKKIYFKRWFPAKVKQQQ